MNTNSGIVRPGSDERTLHGECIEIFIQYMEEANGGIM